MCNLLLRMLITRAVPLPPIYNVIWSLKKQPFSSLSKSIEKNQNSLIRNSFTVDYLIKSCGFTLERALRASKNVKLHVANQPDSVLALFKDHGFTDTQISKLVKYAPRLLLLNPEKTLSPKLEFLKSKGFSDSDVTMIICKWPDILIRSLENQLIPSFEFFSGFLKSDGKGNIAAFKLRLGVLLFDLEKHGANNVELLKETGVPLKNIGYMLAYQPRVFMTACDKFRQTVDEVSGMGFSPLKLNFLLAVQALRSLSKPTWERKVEAYKKWGWSDDDVAATFRRYPCCMMVSVKKITSIMEFFVNKMGCESSFLLTRPQVLSLSLKNMIAPRCEVYQALVAKGLLKPSDVNLRTLLRITEDSFLIKYIHPHKKEAPELWNLYKTKPFIAK